MLAVPYRLIAQFGLMTLQVVAEFGAFFRFAGAAVRWLPRIGTWAVWRRFGPQLFRIGVASVPVVAITGAFIGMILAIEGYAQFKAIGLEERIGGVISVSVVKQIGPVLAAVMVAGRVGGALTAELGTMRVTEQLDAMKTMATDPILYLVVPRVVACIVMTPLLTLYSDILGVWGGWLVTVQFFEVPSYSYWDFTSHFIGWWEPVSGLIKSVFFGASIGLIACYKGYNCRPGAAGVGRACTEAFVASFLTIIALNLVLAKLLNSINVMFIEQTNATALG